jgi:hypothetical protein
VSWVLLAVGTVSIPAGQSAEPRLAVPTPAVPAILDAFRSHDVVALSDSDDSGSAFRLSLIRDPQFASIVNDIVVEFGNALYQSVIDRFVGGGDVPDPVLRQVWQNTTQANATWDGPMYEGLFRTVRTVNASLPRERQLRVLLGDPPIDWDGVRSKADRDRWIGLRDTYPADLIRMEVLAKHRRGLVVYGPLHLQRRNLAANYESEGLAETLVSRLESQGTTKAFTIWPGPGRLQANIRSWPKPSIALLRGTLLGAADFTSYYPSPPTRFSVKAGNLVPIPRNQWRSLRMEDQFDAVLYLGSEPSTMTTTQLPLALCADAAYMKMRLERMSLVGMPQGEVDQLKLYCASVVPK